MTLPIYIEVSKRKCGVNNGLQHIAFDFKENSPADMILGLENLSNNETLTGHQKRKTPKKTIIIQKKSQLRNV